MLLCVTSRDDRKILAQLLLNELVEMIWIMSLCSFFSRKLQTSMKVTENDCINRRQSLDWESWIGHSSASDSRPEMDVVTGL